MAFRLPGKEANKELCIMGNFINKMNPRDKSVLLYVATFFITFGTALCIIVFAIVSLVDTTKCSEMGTALAALMITIAVLFLASVVVVGLVSRKLFPKTSGCLAAVIGYGIVLFMSYLCVGFGLLVAFNC